MRYVEKLLLGCNSLSPGCSSAGLTLSPLLLVWLMLLLIVLYDAVTGWTFVVVCHCS